MMSITFLKIQISNLVMADPCADTQWTRFFTVKLSHFDRLYSVVRVILHRSVL